MKKLLLLGLVLSSVSYVYAACLGNYCYDDTGNTVNGATQFVGPIRLPVYTATQITSLAGPTTGQALIQCFNCTQGSGLCYSTGSVTGSWVLISSGGAMANTHCQ